MKTLYPIGYLVAGLAIGVIVGRGSNSSSNTRRDDSEPARTRSARQERPASLGSDRAHINSIRNASPSQLAALTRQAMTISDPVEMRRYLTECLLNMTPDNWQEVVAGFDKLSKETGRDTPDEWKLALFRAGQIAGANAMDSYLSAGLKSKSQESWHTLYGWSTKDPHAALAWLKNAEATGHEITSNNYTALVAGAALNNPQDALQLLAQIPPQLRRDCAGDVVWNVMQNGGTDGLAPLLQYASTLDTTNSNDAKLANDLFQQVSDKLLWKADHSLDVSEACEAVVKLTQYGQDPTKTTYRALQKYRYYAVPDKLRLIETIRAAPHSSQLDLPYLASAVMDTMNNGNNDAAAVREWMDKNPNSPLVPLLEKRVVDGP
ncbi:MAG: hypothetical protein ABI162_06125 [Luteolibacter sp.]